MDYERVLNEKIKLVKPSGIRRFFDIVATRENVISLGIGEPDFDTPWSIRERASFTEQGVEKYTSNSGCSSCAGIADYYKRGLMWAMTARTRH